MTLNNDPKILFTESSQGSSLNKAPVVPVAIFWGGINISDITGPTPFVDISSEVSRQENGVAESIKNSITLTGKIVRIPAPRVAPTGDDCRDRILNPDTAGIQGLLSGASGLQQLFKKCNVANFEIKCAPPGGGVPITVLYSASGVRFLNINIDQGNDNWTKTADFTVNLEFEEPIGDEADAVKETSETWNIEPIDDTVYTRFTVPIQQRSEWSNPKMKPVVPGFPAPLVPAAGGAPGNNLQIMSIPQFRITHRLSAKGIAIPSGTGSPCNTGINIPTSPTVMLPAYVSAKSWVDKQSALAFNGNRVGITGIAASGGEPYFTKMPILTEFRKIWIYNHSRSINLDVNNGTYEATDTFLAMPTGMPYIESYTVETSTSADSIRTSRVAGNVQGLSYVPFVSLEAQTGVFPTGTGSIGNPVGQMSLEFAFSSTSGGPITPSYDLPDVSGVKSIIANITPSKYQNAVSGWLNDIKPYLYRRASLASQSADRTKPYAPNFVEIPPKPPENPIYAKESLLSVIPVSTSEGHDPSKGTISYSYEYNNKFNIISGVLSESITISNEGPADVVSETQIPGRALGPVLTKGGTTATKKTLSIEITVMPPTGINGYFVSNPECPVFTGGYIYNIMNRLIEGIKPFGATYGRIDIFGKYATTKNQRGTVFVNSDQDTWTPTDGRYSRTISWTYQQCTNTKFYLDH